MKPIILIIKVFLIFTLLTGVIYPLFITGLSETLFPAKANGSIVYKGNIAVGSKLIGQKFDSPNYLTSRPSAVDYNSLPSGGSNFGPSYAKLYDFVNIHRNNFISINNLDSLISVPSEMVCASASGLDPHITPEAAFLQADRIGLARDFNSGQKQLLIQLIQNHIEKPQFSFLGEERVNVLMLNLEIDKLR